MFQNIRATFHRQPVATSVFGAVTAIALLLAVSLAVDLAYWSAHEREQAQPWMTVGYVARSWDLHGPDIDAKAGLPLPQGRPLTLQEIADQRGVPVETLVEAVDKAVAELSAERKKAKSK
jgi:hypothetical protein